VVQQLSKAHQGLGLAIRQIRLERRLSQEELAVLSHLHRNYVGGIERGERNPSFTNLVRVAEALDVRLSSLVALSEKLGGGAKTAGKTS
jgi:transcriptional regulator with XRE-family HTH domain